MIWWPPHLSGEVTVTRPYSHTLLQHEMLSEVYKGTETPRNKGPGAARRREVFFPLWFWHLLLAGLCIKSLA